VTIGRSVYRIGKICAHRLYGITQQQGKEQVEDQEDAGKIIWAEIQPLRCLIREDQVKYER
jgi:hypothetical protein